MKNFLFCLFLFPLFTNAQIVKTIAGNGIAGYTGDGSAATAAAINDPSGVVFDPSGNLYMSDFNNHVVRKISVSGIITTIAGTGTAGYTGDGGAASVAKINGPVNLAFDGSGNLYIADINSNVVRKISASGIISTIAGTGVSGYSGDGGAATVANLNRPSGLAADGTGNLYIADCSNNAIRKVSVTGIITTYAGTGGSGSSGDGGPATTAHVFQPFGVAADPAGNVYVAESPSNKVRKITPAGIISTFAGTGVSGFSGDGAAATVALLSNPAGVATDNAGNVYIADQFNYRIRKVSSAGIITTIIGDGTPGYTGDGGPAIAAEINYNNTLTFDASWDLCFSDNLNNRVRIISNCTNAITTQPKHDTVFAGKGAIYSVSTSMSSPVYQWQENPGTGFVNLANVWPFSGVTTNTLTIIYAGTSLNTTHYRCVISNGSSCTDTSSSAILIVKPGAGIKQLSAESIHVFPNPADDKIVIELPFQYCEGSIQLINGPGQILMEQKVSNPITNLNLGKLPSGMYIIKYQYNGQSLYKKVFKN